MWRVLQIMTLPLYSNVVNIVSRGVGVTVHPPFWGFQKLIWSKFQNMYDKRHTCANSTVSYFIFNKYILNLLIVDRLELTKYKSHRFGSSKFYRPFSNLHPTSKTPGYAHGIHSYMMSQHWTFILMSLPWIYYKVEITISYITLFWKIQNDYRYKIRQH